MMHQPDPAISYEELLSYRTPIRVYAVRGCKCRFGLTTYPICPRCQRTMPREYQSFCDRCGQALDWKEFDKAIILLPH